MWNSLFPPPSAPIAAIGEAAAAAAAGVGGGGGEGGGGGATAAAGHVFGAAGAAMVQVSRDQWRWQCARERIQYRIL